MSATEYCSVEPAKNQLLRDSASFSFRLLQHYLPVADFCPTVVRARERLAASRLQRFRARRL